MYTIDRTDSIFQACYDAHRCLESGKAYNSELTYNGLQIALWHNPDAVISNAIRITINGDNANARYFRKGQLKQMIDHIVR